MHKSTNLITRPNTHTHEHLGEETCSLTFISEISWKSIITFSVYGFVLFFPGEVLQLIAEEGLMGFFKGAFVRTAWMTIGGVIYWYVFF